MPWRLVESVQAEIVILFHVIQAKGVVMMDDRIEAVIRVGQRAEKNAWTAMEEFKKNPVGIPRPGSPMRG